VRDPNVIGAVPLPPYRPASAPAQSTPASGRPAIDTNCLMHLLKYNAVCY
jgi:hypothetical protein